MSTSDFIFESEAAYSNKNSQKANILGKQLKEEKPDHKKSSFAAQTPQVPQNQKIGISEEAFVKNFTDVNIKEENVYSSSKNNATLVSNLNAPNIQTSNFHNTVILAAGQQSVGQKQSSTNI